MDDLDVGEVLDRARIDCERHGVDAVAVGALPTRANDTTVQHARDAHVRGIGLLAADDVRDVVLVRPRDADLRVLTDRLRRRDTGVQRGRRELDVERLAADQLTVRDGLPTAGDDTLAHRQARRGDAEVRRRHCEQCLLRLGRGSTDQRSTLRDRRAAAGVAGVRRRRRTARVELDVPELTDVHVELFGGDQHQAHDRALAEIDPARVERRGAVAVDDQERVDGVRIAGTRACERIDTCG